MISANYYFAKDLRYDKLAVANIYQVKHMLKILTFSAALLLNQTAYSAPSPVASPAPAVSSVKPEATEIKHSEEGNYQQVIEEYKTYVASVDKNVRDEIVNFRKEMVKLNKQKHNTYKALSQEAQKYLAKERELKRKLPLEQRKVFKDEAAEAAAE